MGFINMMDGDFHLHLPSGSVARWTTRTADGRTKLQALDGEGESIGLSLVAKDGAAFGPGE